MINLNPGPGFSWCDLLAAHYTWNLKTINRYIVHWARSVAHGKNNRRQTVVMAKFVEGGTIGPAPKV